jgi:nicotinamidase-related amidase
MIKIDLIIIDPQVDFCNPTGNLYVKGAEEDMRRVSEMITRIGDKLNDIHVTLDTHHLFDVAHPLYWKDSSGKHPDPFTIITLQDLKDGKWLTSIPSLQKRSTVYVEELEKNNRYPLCVWPPHCLIGTEGHAVTSPLQATLREWEEKNIAMVDYVTKGSNFYTEHYSGIKADVPDPDDPSTQVNTNLITTLEQSDEIVICGEAGSHCLANTTRDLITEFGDESQIKKLILLEDGTSPVPTFENLQTDFISEMTTKGMRLSKTTEYLK